MPLSIILVSYHTGAPLFDAIAAARRQNGLQDLVIVDNGNPPEVLAQLRDIAAQDTRVKFLTGHGNIGFGRANNLGVKAATGDYILLVNPDCMLRDDTAEKLLHQAATLPKPFIIGARILNEDGSDQRGCRRELLTPTSAFVEALHLSRFFPMLRLNKHDDPVPTSISPVPAISGAFMFMPRKSFDLIGGFDEGYFLHVEDLDLCFRFRKAGGEIYFAPDIPVTHIGATSDAPSDFIERHKTRGFSRYFHHNFGDSSPFWLLWCLDIAIWMRYFIRRTMIKATK